jgi:glycerol uptake facilitator-like aquaporin
MAYTIGHVSGCHINPAVTLSFLVARKVTIVQAAYYWVAQFAGAALGGLIVWIISDTGDLDNTVNAQGQQIFAANGWGADIGSPFGMGSAIAVEIVFTALLVFVVLATTGGGYLVGFGGLSAGLTLAMIHLATIPVDNTSVNPARSFGSALFSGTRRVDAAVGVHRLPAGWRRRRCGRLVARPRGTARRHRTRRLRRLGCRPRPRHQPPRSAARGLTGTALEVGAAARTAA